MATISEVRNLIGDTNPSNYQCTDDEINAFITFGITALKAAALALRNIASKKSFTAKDVSAGNYRENATAAIKFIMDLAKQYEDMDSMVPAEAQVEVVYNDFNYREILRNKVLRLESIYES